MPKTYVPEINTCSVTRHCAHLALHKLKIYYLYRSNVHGQNSFGQKKKSFCQTQDSSDSLGLIVESFSILHYINQ